MAKTKAPKPTQTYEPIPSDEVEDEPRLSGALRGLNPAKYLLRDPAAQSTTETADEDNEVVFTPSNTRHATRASRGNGKPVSYDQKFHPMDVVTRPNSAAVRRRSGSRSYAKSDEEDEAHSDGDDETSQSSARSSGDESAESSQDGPKSSAPPKRIVLGPRTPNPQASRHSSRKAAQKAVIYSRKYHPQDYGLPGFQHKAIVIEDDQHDENEVPTVEPRKRKAASSDMEQQSSDKMETAAAQQAPRRPHKKLKSLRDARPAHTKKKRVRPSKAASKVKQHRTSHDIEDLVETAIRGSQAPAPVVISSGDESGDESDNQGAANYRTATDEPGYADSNEQVDTPRQLLEACTSNMPESDSSGDRDDLNDSSLIDTSTTFTGEAGTLATLVSHVPETTDSLAQVPTYLTDRIALKLGGRASVTATKLLRILFDESHAGTATDLVVQRPYLHYPSQPPMSAGQRTSIADSEDEYEDRGPLRVIDIGNEDEVSPSQRTSKADSEDVDEDHGPLRVIDIGDENEAAYDNALEFGDPYESNTPMENQFEDQIAVTESSQHLGMIDENDGLADSDPIRGFTAMNHEQVEPERSGKDAHTTTVSPLRARSVVSCSL